MNYLICTSSKPLLSVIVAVLTMGSSTPSIKTQFPAGTLFTSILYLWQQIYYTSKIKVICLWFCFLNRTRESTEYTVVTHIGVWVKPKLILFIPDANLTSIKIAQPIHLHMYINVIIIHNHYRIFMICPPTCDHLATV